MKDTPLVSDIDPFEKYRKKIKPLKLPDIKKPANGVRSSSNLSNLDTESATLSRAHKPA